MSRYKMAVKVDSRGRLPLLRKLRNSMQPKAGDTQFVQYESESRIVRLAKVTSPLGHLGRRSQKSF